MTKGGSQLTWEGGRAGISKNVTDAGSQLTWEGGGAGISKNVTDAGVFRDSVDAEEDSNTNRWGLVGKGGEEENLKVWQVWNFQKDNFFHRSAWREGDNNVGENKSFFPGK